MEPAKGPSVIRHDTEQLSEVVGQGSVYVCDGKPQRPALNKIEESRTLRKCLRDVSQLVLVV